MMDMNNRGLSFKVSRLVGMLVDKTVTKTSELRENAVNNIGFLKFLYRERVAFYKMYQLQKAELNNVNRVVDFLGKQHKDVKRLHSLKSRSEASEKVREVAEFLDTTSATYEEYLASRNNLQDFTYVGDYKRDVGKVPQMDRDHELNKSAGK